MKTIKEMIIADKKYSSLISTVYDGVSSSFNSISFPLDNYAIFPGFCDVHVHFREPGFFYKESIETGSNSALRGGYTAVCTMPNLNPVPDSVENIKIQKEIIDKTATVNVYPYASITVKQMGEELSDFEGMKDFAIAYSDDGKGVQNPKIMKEAMLKAKALGKIIVAHCEENSLLNGGYIHDGEYAKIHGHRGICSASEYIPIERDIELLRQTGASYHVCHISTKESVELIRKAKAEGLDITCETAPHYLVMNDLDLEEDGRFKMNPPLRGEEDRLALIEGIKDGTIDMIATDHAPHSSEEKSKGLEKSAFGVVGLETAFPVLYTKLVKTGIITLEKLIDLLVFNARERFNIPLGKDFSVWDLNEEFEVNPEEFLSKGRATPFEGERLYGVNLLTVVNGEFLYKRK